MDVRNAIHGLELWPFDGDHVRMRSSVHRYGIPPSVRRRGFAAVRAAREVGPQGRLLPDFLLVGGQRCGTTSLHRYLSRPPGRRHGVPQGGQLLRRELAARRALVPGALPHPPSRGAGPGGAAATRSRSGEATPYYLFHPAVPQRVARTRARRAPDRSAARAGRAGLVGLPAAARDRAPSRSTFADAIGAEPRAAGRRGGAAAGRPRPTAAAPTATTRTRPAACTPSSSSGGSPRFPREQLLVMESGALFAEPGRHRRPACSRSWAARPARRRRTRSPRTRSGAAACRRSPPRRAAAGTIPRAQRRLFALLGERLRVERRMTGPPILITGAHRTGHDLGRPHAGGGRRARLHRRAVLACCTDPACWRPGSTPGSPTSPPTRTAALTAPVGADARLPLRRRRPSCAPCARRATPAAWCATPAGSAGSGATASAAGQGPGGAARGALAGRPRSGWTWSSPIRHPAAFAELAQTDGLDAPVRPLPRPAGADGRAAGRLPRPGRAVRAPIRRTWSTRRACCGRCCTT